MMLMAALSVGILAGCGTGTNGPKTLFLACSAVKTDWALRWTPLGARQNDKAENSNPSAKQPVTWAIRLIPDRALVMDYYQLMVSGMTPMVVIMDSTMHVHIKAEIPDGGFIADATITGSKAASEVHEYYAKAMPLQTTLSMLRGTMQRTKDKEKMQELSDRAAQKKIEADRWAKQFIKEHPGSPALWARWNTSNPVPTLRCSTKS